MQTKKQSIIETIVNITIGLAVSFLIQITIYPLMGIPVTMKQNVLITIIFFIASFLRGYILRRFFNKIHNK